MNQELQAARIKHLAFKSKIRALVYGADVTGDVLISETDCALGRWIINTGRLLFSHYPEMAELEKVHSQLHEVVNILVDFCQKDDCESARLRMPEVEQISDKMTKLLERIDEHIVSGK